MSSKLWKTIYLLLGLQFISSIAAALVLRPLYGDGSFWFFYMLDNRKFFYDVHFFRFISFVIEWPGILATHIFPESIRTPVATYIMSLCFSLHPFVSLAVCHKILKERRALDLFIFPLLSFALCSQALMLYPSIVAPETLSVFWVLFFLILFNGNYILSMLLSALLAFGYEPGILLCLLNISILLFKLSRATQSKTRLLSLLFVNLAAAAFIVWRLQQPISGPKQIFLEALLSRPEAAFRLWAIALVCAAVSLFFRSLWLKCAGMALAAAATLYFFYYMSEPWHWLFLRDDVWFIRTTVIPLTTGLAVLAAFAYFFRRALSRLALGLGILALAGTLPYDLIQTHLWHQSISRIRGFAEKNPGCNAISYAAFSKITQGYMAAEDVFIPFISALSPAKRQIHSILTTERELTGDSCRLNEKRQWTLSGGVFPFSPFEVYQYDFSSVISQPIRLHDLDESGKLITKVLEAPERSP